LAVRIAAWFQDRGDHERCRIVSVMPSRRASLRRDFTGELSMQT
jgi:hypothetical protein